MYSAAVSPTELFCRTSIKEMNPRTSSQQRTNSAIHDVYRIAIKLADAHSDYSVVSSQIPKPPIVGRRFHFTGAYGEFSQNPIELWPANCGGIPTDPRSSASRCIHHRLPPHVSAERHGPRRLTSIGRFASRAPALYVQRSMRRFPSRRKAAVLRVACHREAMLRIDADRPSMPAFGRTRFSFSVRKLTFSSSRSDARKHRYGDASHRRAPTALTCPPSAGRFSRSLVRASIRSRSGRRSRLDA